MKKTLAILLSLALIVCMMPTAVFAEVEGDLAPIEIKENMVSLSKSTAVYNGQDQIPTVTVEGVDSDNYTLKWAAGDLNVTQIEADDVAGLTAITDAGTYSVLVKGKGTGYSGSVVKKFTITQYDLSKVNILIDNQTAVPADNAFVNLQTGTVKYYYNGELISTADITSIFANALDVILSPTEPNKKYTVSFSIKNEKKANFSGSISSTSFGIVDDIASAQLRKINGTDALTDISGGVYDGKSKKVADLFTLYYGSNKLVYGKDYSVRCDETTKAGTHTVIIKGQGAYGGTKLTNIIIERRNANTYVKADTIPDQTVKTLNSIEPVLKDTTLNLTLKKGTDYVIESRSGQPGEKGSIVVSFIGNYTGSSLVIPFNVVSDEKNIDNNDIQVYYGNTNVTAGTLSARTYLYNGSVQLLNNISVYKDTAAYTVKTALSSSYYSLSYEYTDKDNKTITTSAPVDAHDYRVYLIGRNGYAGKRYLGIYSIPKYNTSNVDVTVAMANAAAIPTVTVKSKYENITFVRDKDYTVSYYVNSSTGKVYVSVTPTIYGNLTGLSTSDYYPIVAKSITSCTASFTNGKSSVAYTGYTIPVDVTVKDGNYTTLTKGTHYTVTYKDAAGTTVTSIKDAGSYTVEITGIGLYTGKITLTFTVTGNDISTYTVTLKESSVNVSDKAQTPVIESVKKGTTTLASTNYTVSYQDAAGKTVTSMKDPGTYKVVVTGNGAYSGSAYATFRIVGLTQTVTTEKSSYKAYKSSDAFNIEAESNVPNTTLTYTSSNPSVANVSATGTVTVNKVGRAVINVSAPATGKYEAASTSVVVKVYPKKGAMSRSLWTDGKKKQIKVRWYYQDGATQYQIRYSRYKNFSSYLTNKVVPYGNENYITNTATIKNLKSKTKYYVKVRAVYTDEATGEIYYGAWSGYRTIITK